MELLRCHPCSCSRWPGSCEDLRGQQHGDKGNFLTRCSHPEDWPYDTHVPGQVFQGSQNHDGIGHRDIVDAILVRCAKNGLVPELDRCFGSMVTSGLCLFQVITGGFDWIEMSNLLAFSSESVAVLCLYVGMMNFLILNILTGICCDRATRSAAIDFDVQMHEDGLREASATANLEQYFYDNDVSVDGRITWKQLDSRFSDPLVKKWFKRVGLERWHLQSFFDHWHVNNDCEQAIDIATLIRCCKRLRCNVTNVDLIAAGCRQDASSKKQYLQLRNMLEEVHQVIALWPQNVQL